MMSPSALSTIRCAVCAIGLIRSTSEEFYASPKRDLFEIEGTGFLAAPQRVVTCAHVVDSLTRQARKMGPRPHAIALQFVYPPTVAADMTTVFRSFRVVWADERIDAAVLAVEGDPLAVAHVPVVSVENRLLSVGEPIGLCGYAHGSALLTRRKEIYRFGPVVQTGIVAALSPFDGPQPDTAILDLVTGPAASGSPIFRQETGEVFGVLVEGQMKGSAALSIARLIYRAANGQVSAGIAGVEMTRAVRL